MKGASTEEFRVTTDEQRTTTKQDHSRQKFKPKNPDGSLLSHTWRARSPDADEE